MRFPLQPAPGSFLARVLFVGSAAAAALALLLAWRQPLVGIVLLALIAVLWTGRTLARRRTRRLLKSGDVEVVLARWSDAFERVPHPKTMRPLLTATACAANGWVERARQAMRSAERGPAWEAALEHRLFVDSLLLTFEGDHEEALARANTLQGLPVPNLGGNIVTRVQMLRRSVGALARAFSHRSIAGDRALMLSASDASPLVYWPMRYGAAIISIDEGQIGEARQLLAGAPAWPAESCFARFHSEIAAEVERRADV